MGYLDDLINPKLDPIIQHKRMLDENLKFQNEQVKEKLLNDPTAADHILARLSRSAMTDKAAAKMPEGASFEKAMSQIDIDDPRRKMLAQLQTDLPSIIKGSAYGANPAESIMKAVQERGAASKEDIYKHIQSNSGMFGKSVAPPADAADYEAWDEKNPTWTNPITSAIMGAGGELASIPILGQAAKFALAGSPKIAGALRLAGGALSMAPPIPGWGMGAKIVGAGLMSVAAMAGLDAVKKAAASGGHPLSGMEEFAASIPIFGGVNALAKVGGGIAGKTLNSLKGLDLTAGNVLPKEFAAKSFITRENTMKALDETAAKELPIFRSKQETIAKYGQLTDEDKNLILQNPNKEQEILTARIKTNIEGEIANKKIADDKSYADTLKGADEFQAQNPGMERDDALLFGRRKYSPSTEMVVEDIARLKKMDVPDTVIDSMNSVQRFETIKTRTNSLLQQQKEVEVDKMLPALVTANKAKPFKLISGAEQSALAGRITPAGQIPIIPRVKGVQQPLGAVTIESDFLRTDISDFTTNLTTKAEEIASFTGSALDKKSKIQMLSVSTFDALNALETQYKGAIGAKQIAELSTKRTAILKSLTPLEKEAADVTVSTATKDVESMFGTVQKMNAAGYVKGEVPDATKQATRREAAREIKKTFGSKVKLSELEASTDPVVKEKLGSILTKYASVLGVAGVATVVGTGMIPVDSMFTNKAEAMPFVGRSMPTLVASVIKGSGKSIAQSVDAAIEAGFGSPVVSATGDSVESFMRQKSFAPANIDVFKRTGTVRVLDSLGSLHTRGRYHLATQLADGSEGQTNAGVVLAYVSQLINANTEAGIGVSANIIKKYGLGNKVDEITAAFQPLKDKYHNTINLEVPLYHGKIQMYNDVLNGVYKGESDSKLSKLTDAMKYVKKDASKLNEEDKIIYDLITAEKQKSIDALEKLKPMVADFEKEYDVYARDVASKYSTSRVALATDGYGMSGKDPWLASMLAPEEREAVDKITSLMSSYSARMQEGGHQVVAGPFMHHAAHPSADFNKSVEYLNTLTGDGAEAMRLVNFYHRSAGSKMMMPETGYTLGKYIPDAEKRLQVSDFWKMGKEGGWDSVLQKMKRSRGFDGAEKLLGDIRTAFDPLDTGSAAKWLNTYAAFEVARLLTLSPSVSFKHGLKLMGNWAIFPASTMTKATPMGLDIAGRGMAQDLAGETFKGKDMVADLYKAYTNQSHIYDLQQ